jgi:glutamine amidotransferase
MIAPTIAIVDYGLGNLFSISRACEWAGMAPLVTADGGEMERRDAVMLPGVGAFAEAMKALEQRGLVSVLRDLAAAGKPLIGICLGQQLLMSESHEFGVHEGLGLIEGTVERLPGGHVVKRIKVPQVGWNKIAPRQGGDWRGSMLEGLAAGTYMYFVHSYYVRPSDPAVVLASSRFGGDDFCSAVRKGNITACQFHPEKSGRDGLSVYRNIARLLRQGGLGLEQ